MNHDRELHIVVFQCQHFLELSTLGGDPTEDKKTKVLFDCKIIFDLELSAHRFEFNDDITMMILRMTSTWTSKLIQSRIRSQNKKLTLIIVFANIEIHLNTRRSLESRHQCVSEYAKCFASYKAQKPIKILKQITTRAE